MIPILKLKDLTQEQILNRDIRAEENVSAAVDAVIEAVRKNGDAALLEYTEKFDGVKLENLQVSDEEIARAIMQVSPDLVDTIRAAAANIEAFHRAQTRQDVVLTDRPGIVLGQRYTPIEKVGICVPRSPVAFPSTILMNVIPAKIAGVKDIVLVTPPEKDGSVSPAALVAAGIAGVDRIFKIGGAQAVAALAYGTESVPRVDKIVGPGNAYVAEAITSCSAWLSRSAATQPGSQVPSANTKISLGPAIMSMPTLPKTLRLAVATKMPPGPTILSTAGTLSVP